MHLNLVRFQNLYFGVDFRARFRAPFRARFRARFRADFRAGFRAQIGKVHNSLLFTYQKVLSRRVNHMICLILCLLHQL